jgi:hypothetical protein
MLNSVDSADRIMYGQNVPKMPGVLGLVVILALAVDMPFAPASALLQPQIPDGEAVIHGPGLARPLELAGQPFFDLTYLAGLLPDWSPPPPGQHVPSPPAGTLGPPYDVVYSFPVAGQRRPVSLEQTFYFEAPNLGDVWVHTLAGQGIPLTGGGRLDVPEGWWRSPVLSDFLQAVALPEGIAEFPPVQAEAAASSSDTTAIPASREPEPSEAAAPGTRVLLGIAALGLMLFLGSLGSRPTTGKA